MEVILWIIGILIVIGTISSIMESFENWFGNINWEEFFKYLVFGGIILAVIFSFTSEGVLIVIGFYFVLIILALIAGKFKK
jgi:hypothetical protein